MHNISIITSILTTMTTNWQFAVKGEHCTLGVGGAGSNAENALKVQLLPPSCIGAYGIDDVVPGANNNIHAASAANNVGGADHDVTMEEEEGGANTACETPSLDCY